MQEENGIQDAQKLKIVLIKQLKKIIRVFLFILHGIYTIYIYLDISDSQENDHKGKVFKTHSFKKPHKKDSDKKKVSNK